MRRAVLLVALMACGPAMAERDPPSSAGSEPQRTTATFEDWTLRCVRPPREAAACEVSQTVYNKAQPVAQTAMGRPVPNEKMRLTILVPVSIQIGPAPRLLFGDNDTAIELTWRRCLPSGCLADVALDDEQVRKLRERSENGRIVFDDAGGHEAVIPFAPRGLGAALDALAKAPG